MKCLKKRLDLGLSVPIPRPVIQRSRSREILVGLGFVSVSEAQGLVCIPGYHSIKLLTLIRYQACMVLHVIERNTVTSYCESDDPMLSLYYYKRPQQVEIYESAILDHLISPYFSHCI